MSTDAPEIVLEMWGVTVMYGSARGIEDVSLSVPAGQVTGLLGPSGSGKTTLLRAVLDLVHPQQGSIDIVTISSKDRRARGNVAYLPGDLSLPGRLTGEALLRRSVRPVVGYDPGGIISRRLGLDLAGPWAHCPGQQAKVGRTRLRQVAESSCSTSQHPDSTRCFRGNSPRSSTKH